MLVDDIVDTGRSIAFAAAQLRQRRIGDLWTCALLDKPQRRDIEVAIDFVGFMIGDVFVVGYGTDYAAKYRYLPYNGGGGVTRRARPFTGESGRTQASVVNPAVRPGRAAAALGCGAPMHRA